MLIDISISLIRAINRDREPQRLQSRALVGLHAGRLLERQHLASATRPATPAWCWHRLLALMRRILGPVNYFCFVETTRESFAFLATSLAGALI